MARISATASLGIKRGMEGKKGWGKYDNISPHHSMTIEREVPDDLTDEELVERTEKLHTLVRRLVEKKIQEDQKTITEHP